MNAFANVSAFTRAGVNESESARGSVNASALCSGASEHSVTEHGAFWLTAAAITCTLFIVILALLCDRSRLKSVAAREIEYLTRIAERPPLTPINTTRPPFTIRIVPATPAGSASSKSKSTGSGSGTGSDAGTGAGTGSGRFDAGSGRFYADDEDDDDDEQFASGMRSPRIGGDLAEPPSADAASARTKRHTRSASSGQVFQSITSALESDSDDDANSRAPHTSQAHTPS